MSQLWHKDAQTLKELAETLGIKAPSLTSIVDGMVSKGWVVRKSVDEDARISKFSLLVLKLPETLSVQQTVTN